MNNSISKPWHTLARATAPRVSTLASFGLIMLLIMLGGWVAAAFDADDDEKVSVPGSDTKYAVAIESTIGDQNVKLVLTGAAQRKKDFVKVYTIGGYVADGLASKDASELAQKDCAKQLHIVMERGVDGKTMAEAFIDGIRLNCSESQFSDENKTLLEFMEGKDLEKGDHVWLTHVPGVGFQCGLPGDHEVTIKSVPFAVAIWEIYLGNKNIGDAVKVGLTSRLPIAAKQDAKS